jgi:hypothetical protein
MSPSKFLTSLASCLGVATLISLVGADETPSATPQIVANSSETAPREAAVQILKPLGTLVGEWKGVGQPKRGSNVGAWSEKAQSAWHFEEKSAALLVTFEPGQQFHSAAFSVARDGTTTQLVLTPIKGDRIELTRSNVNPEDADKTWIFESDAEGAPQTRCTVRIISDIRITILFEERPMGNSAWRRLSEIGMTRAGAKLANGNTGERQCIVTGGLGTIKVSFEGKAYYVCCEGCKQAFDADPAGTLQDYRERLKNAAKK